MQKQEEALGHLRVLFVTSLTPNQFGVYRLGALRRLGLEHVAVLDRDQLLCAGHPRQGSIPATDGAGSLALQPRFACLADREGADSNP